MTYNPRRGPSETYSATCFRNLEPTRGVCVRTDHRVPTRSRSLSVAKSGCTVDLAAIAAPHDLRFTRPPLLTEIVGGITVFNGSRYRMGFKNEHRTGAALVDFYVSKNSAANFLGKSGNLIIRQETTGTCQQPIILAFLNFREIFQQNGKTRFHRRSYATLRGPRYKANLQRASSVGLWCRTQNSRFAKIPEACHSSFREPVAHLCLHRLSPTTLLSFYTT